MKTMKDDPLPRISFAAICDGRPDDQLSSDPERLHTFAIIQDVEPSDLIAFADRISTRMRRATLSSWAGRPDSYKTSFANALKQELCADGGRIRVYEATEAEMIRTERKARNLMPLSVNYQVHSRNAAPFQITAAGHSINERTKSRIEPKARWLVGVVVTWIAMAITDFFDDVATESERVHGEIPYMVLLPDRLPLDPTEKPGATSLLRAILHGTLGKNLGQQYSGTNAPDNEAEKLVDNIVGLYNERHSAPDTDASRLAVDIMNDPVCSQRIIVQNFGPENLADRLPDEFIANMLAPRNAVAPPMSTTLLREARSLD